MVHVTDEQQLQTCEISKTNFGKCGALKRTFEELEATASVDSPVNKFFTCLSNRDSILSVSPLSSWRNYVSGSRVLELPPVT
jgi:hypothetical protein